MVGPGRGRWLIGLALIAGVLVPRAAGGEAGAAAACVDDVVPVALGPGRPADQKIVVELCGPTPLEGRVVHLLISGATYGPSTWDLPYQPERYSDAIKAPVLDVMGEHDAWFCSGQPCSSSTGTPARERQWFDATSCFEQYVLPEAGHDINVHYTAQQWFAVAVEWTRRMVGAGGPCRAQN